MGNIDKALLPAGKRMAPIIKGIKRYPRDHYTCLIERKKKTPYLLPRFLQVNNNNRFGTDHFPLTTNKFYQNKNHSSTVILDENRRIGFTFARDFFIIYPMKKADKRKNHIASLKERAGGIIFLLFPTRDKVYKYLSFQALITTFAVMISFIIFAFTNFSVFFLLLLFSFPIGFLLFLLIEFFSEQGINLALGFSSAPDTRSLLSPYYDKVKLALREERYEIALAFLERIIEISPKELPAHLETARIYHHKLKNYARALERYRKILNIVGWDEKPNAFYIEAKKGIAGITKVLAGEQPET
jgi:tetratricopeptide (TPR) repeat protein